MGQAVPRKEGIEKVTGRARYIDDFSFPGMLYGATVRSRVPRGRIRRISYEPGIPWHEFVVVTAEDIPGSNAVALILDDQPYLAAEFVNHPEEPILLLAHPNRSLLPAAVAAVHITYQELPAVYTIEESEKKEQIIWGEGKKPTPSRPT